MPRGYGIAPGLDGLIAAQQQGREQDTAALQQGVGLMGLLQAAQKQQQAAQYRGALSKLGPDASQEDIINTIRPYVGPDKLMSTIQSAANKKETTQMMMLKLQESRDQFERRMQEAYRVNPDPQAKALIDQQYKQGMLNFKKFEATLHGATTAYKVGGQFNVPDAPVLGLGPVAQSPQQPGALRTTAPSNDEALRMVQAADAAGIPASVSGPVPAPAPIPGPAQAPRPVASTPAMPDAPVAAPVPTAAVTQPKPDEGMPAFSGSPREIAQAQNRWRAQQSLEKTRNPELTPEMLAAKGAQIAAGMPISQVLPGYGRQMAGQRDKASAEAIRQIKAQNPGMTDAAAGEELSNRAIMRFAGNKSVGQLNTMLGATRQAVDQLDFNVKGVSAAMEKLGAGGITDLSPVINAIARGEQKWTGNPAYSELYYYMFASGQESARILSGGQASVAQLYQGAAEEAKKWASTNMTTPKAWNEGVAPAMLAEGRERIKTYERAIEKQMPGANRQPSALSNASPDRRNEPRQETKRVVVDY